MKTPPVLEASNIVVDFPTGRALDGVSLVAQRAEVLCLLGDNGAGKSTLVGVLSGLQRPTSGTYRIEGAPVDGLSPKDALDRGIATVHQDLALIPLMSVWRNFALGAEPTKGRGPLRRLDRDEARRQARREVARMGIELRDPDQAAATLSGGERQSVAIARALHLGARVLILDEPTAALGVKQTQLVLDSVAEARSRGVAVVLITHNVDDALAAGDRFVVLRKGAVAGAFDRSEATRNRLYQLMSGHAE